MKRATTSLPVPDSPVSSTVVSVCATRAACASTSFHCFDCPTTRRWPAARFELARQRGHLRFEPRRRFARLGLTARRFGEALVRQRERQVIRHPSREVDVVFAEPIGLLRRERRASRRPSCQAASARAAPTGRRSGGRSCRAGCSAGPPPRRRESRRRRGGAERDRRRSATGARRIQVRPWRPPSRRPGRTRRPHPRT